VQEPKAQDNLHIPTRALSNAVAHRENDRKSSMWVAWHGPGEKGKRLTHFVDFARRNADVVKVSDMLTNIGVEKGAMRVEERVDTVGVVVCVSDAAVAALIQLSKLCLAERLEGAPDLMH
jgi:hypothetical protein